MEEVASGVPKDVLHRQLSCGANVAPAEMSRLLSPLAKRRLCNAR